MGTFRRLMSVKNLADCRRQGCRSGQIATFFMLIMVAVVIMAMVTANIGEVSLASTAVSNAADAAALNLGSQLATRSSTLREVLRRSKGGEFLEPPNNDVPTPRRCKNAGFWIFVLPIVLSLIAVFTPALAGAMGGQIMAGLKAGALGGFAGGWMDFGDWEGAGVGLLTGAEIGVAIGFGAQAAGGRPYHGPGPWKSGLNLAPVSAGGAQLGGTIGALPTMYNAYMADTMDSRAMASAAKAISGLPDTLRIQQSVVFDGLSRAVNDPTMIIDDGGGCFKTTGQVDCKGKISYPQGKDYKELTVSPDLDGDGDMSDQVPLFSAWWEDHLDRVAAEQDAAKYQKIHEKIAEFVKRDGRLWDLRRRLRWYLTEKVTNIDKQPTRGFFQGWDRLNHDMELKPSPIDGTNPPKFKGKSRRLCPGDGPGRLMKVLRRTKYKDERDMNLCDNGGKSSSTAEYDKMPAWTNGYGHDWEAGPDMMAVDAWYNCEGRCNRIKFGSDARIACLDQCTALPVPIGWDFVDDLRLGLYDLLKVSNFVLNPSNRKMVNDTWEQWILEFHDPEGDTQEIPDWYEGPRPKDGDHALRTLSLGLFGLANWLKNVRDSLEPCKRQNGRLNFPCIRDVVRNGVVVERIATIDDNVSSVGEDEFRQADKGLRDLAEDMKTFYENTAVPFVTAIYGLMYELSNKGITSTTAAKYAWEDSQGEHSVEVIVGPFRIPKLDTKSTLTIGDGYVKCMVLKYGGHWTNSNPDYTWMDGRYGMVSVIRRDPANKRMGWWKWNFLSGNPTDPTFTIRKDAWARWDWTKVELGGTK